MKKFTKISVSGLMACCLAIGATGCLGEPPKAEEPPPPEPGAITTLDDAYAWSDDTKTGSTRPTIDGGWYEPKLPENVEQEPAKITLSLPDGFTVSDDYKTDVMTYNKLILPTAEQITNETGFGDPIGWFNAATGEVFAADSAVQIMGDMTIAPYWQNAQDYDYVKVGSAKANAGYSPDLMVGDFYDITPKMEGNKDTTETKAKFSYAGLYIGGGTAQVVHGGKSGSYLGSTVSYDKPVTAGSAIRFDSKADGKLTSEKVIEFNYGVANYGTEPLKLSIYQISGSSEYKVDGGYYGYESRYRTAIELAPDQGTSEIAQYKLGKNDNFLTYIVFEEDVHSFNFGISISAKVLTDKTEVDEKYNGTNNVERDKVKIKYNPADNGGITLSESYLNQYVGRYIEAPTANDCSGPGRAGWKLLFGENDYGLPKEYVLPATRSTFNGEQTTRLRIPSSVEATLVSVPSQAFTVTYDSANGISAPSGTQTSYYTGDKLVLPAVSGTGTDGGVHAGWYDVATGFMVSGDTQVMSNMTLKPCFTYGDKLYSEKRPSGSDQTPDPCTGCNWADFTFAQNFIVDGRVGYKVDYAGSMTSTSAFRMKHSYNKLDGTTREYQITVTNTGSSTVKFTLWRVNSGTTWAAPTASSDNYGQDKVTTLAAGDSVTFTCTYGFTNSGNNAMLYVQIKEAVENLSLGFAMYVKEATT